MTLSNQLPKDRATVDPRGKETNASVVFLKSADKIGPGRSAAKCL
jgi:hypothetical protein